MTCIKDERKETKMNRVSSYPSIYAIGHKAILDIFNDEVLVEEKIDGSQFSFGLIDGKLQCRSKGQQLVLDAPEKMFVRAVETVTAIQELLTPEWVYRCEYLQKPKHNTLAYSRTPDKNLIIFDVMVGLESYLSHEEKEAEATRLGLEVVPVIFHGHITGIELFKELLETDSILGGCKVEGVVVKNYNLFTRDKKVAIGKYVSEAFKEKHGKEWKKSNPSSADILTRMIATYRHENRWAKAIQHLDEAGQLENTPRDIGSLIKEVQIDIKKECEDEIKDALFAHYWPNIRRGVTTGLPEWYKERLAESAFEETL